jgi:DNA-binding LytR/AlgR family response regulator
MICVGICDDEKQIIEVLKEKIMAYMEFCTMEVNYLEFYSGEELLNSESQLDLLFLDIDMPGMDGIETGKLWGTLGYRFIIPNRKNGMILTRK